MTSDAYAAGAETGVVGDCPYTEPCASDPRLAELYDAFCAGRPDFAFYRPLVMSAGSVLDVGCGTGELLRLAREGGHTGRLCGLDPADAMLQVARRRSDIEWVQGDLLSTAWQRQFDLIVMTGHAFQVWLEDDEIRTSLAAIRDALSDDGRFVFETRNPLVREWERWQSVDEIEHDGVVVRREGWVEPPVGDRVSFVTAFTSASWEGPLVGRSTLRFLDVDSLSSLLSEAGLAVEAQFGDWDRSPLTDSSPEIITIARRA